MQNIIKRFCASRSGNIAVITAILAVPLFLAAGAAFDYSNYSKQTKKTQEALDSAVLAGVAHEGNETSQLETAGDFFKVNVPQDVQYKNLLFRFEGNKLVGTADVDVNTAFMGLIAINALTAPLMASATDATAPGGLRCIHALNAAESSALILNSKPRSSDVYTGASLMAVDCTVHANSNASDAVELKAGEFSSGKNCFVGGFDGDLTLLSPAPEPSCSPLGDPFATHVIAKPLGCSNPTSSYSGGDLEFTPGVYCSGLEVDANNISFQPGTYYIQNGPLNLVASSHIAGDGVSFVLDETTTGFSIEANTVSLKASANGAARSFIIYDRSAGLAGSPGKSKKKKKKKKKGGNQLRVEEYVYLEGIVYVPNNHFELRWRRPATDTSPLWKAPKTPFAAFIADTIDFHGYSQLIFNYDTSKTDLSIPDEIMTLKSVPRLVN